MGIGGFPSNISLKHDLDNGCSPRGMDLARRGNRRYARANPSRSPPCTKPAPTNLDAQDERRTRSTHRRQGGCSLACSQCMKFTERAEILCDRLPRGPWQRERAQQYGRETGHEVDHGDHQAVQAGRGSRSARPDPRAGHDRDRGAGLWSPEGAYRNLSRRRIRHSLSAEDEN